METIQTPYLKFRYLKNRQIHLGDGRLYPISYTTGPKIVNGLPDPLCQSGVSSFDTDRPLEQRIVHEVPLLDEMPDLPVNEEGMPERLYDELCNAAWKVAADNRRTNETIRKSVKAYVESGTIELVEDPFAHKTTKSFGAKPGKPKPPQKDEKPPKGDDKPSDSSENKES
jgi:hypothetical protein